MPKAYAPFGLRPKAGKHYRTLTVPLYASSTSPIGKGDLIYATTSGADRVASDTTPSRILGVSMDYLVAGYTTSKYITIADAWDTIFEIQSADIGTAWTGVTDALIFLDQCQISGSATAPSSTTYNSAVGITLTGSSASTGILLVLGLSQIPGNDFAATSYPIFDVMIWPQLTARYLGGYTS